MKRFKASMIPDAVIRGEKPYKGCFYNFTRNSIEGRRARLKWLKEKFPEHFEPDVFSMDDPE